MYWFFNMYWFFDPQKDLFFPTFSDATFDPPTPIGKPGNPFPRSSTWGVGNGF